MKNVPYSSILVYPFFCVKETISRGNSVKISAVWSSGFDFRSFVVVLTPVGRDARTRQEQVSVNKRSGDMRAGAVSVGLHINNQGAEQSMQMVWGRLSPLLPGLRDNCVKTTGTQNH